MSKIKRYDAWDAEEKQDGICVLYDDHIAAMRMKDEKISELLTKLDDRITRHGQCLEKLQKAKSKKEKGDGTNTQCDGACEQHRGTVRKIREWGLYIPLEKAWLFDYCDEAIAEDKKRGFQIAELLDWHDIFAKSKKEEEKDNG